MNNKRKRTFVLEYTYSRGVRVSNGWWELIDGYCVNRFGGRHKYIASADDKIVEADSYDDLDYSYLLDSNSPIGWIAPDGRFYGCHSTDHALVARHILKSSEEELESKGWIKVFSIPPDGYYCRMFETENQKATLRKLGFETFFG